VDEPPSGTRFHWSATPNTDRYEILWDRLGVPSPGQCLTGDDPDPTDTEYVDPGIPDPGEGWWYLFRGVRDSCGGAPWGPSRLTPSCP
jgi:hypothetical protein